MQIILGLYARRELVPMGGTEERTRGTEMGKEKDNVRAKTWRWWWRKCWLARVEV